MPTSAQSPPWRPTPSKYLIYVILLACVASASPSRAGDQDLSPVAPAFELTSCGADLLVAETDRRGGVLPGKGLGLVPTQLRWAVLHCQFSDANGVPLTQPFVHDLFERPVDGLFDHFERMSQGRTAMFLATSVDVPLGRPLADFPYNSVPDLLNQLSEACLDGADAAVDFGEVDAVAFLFNNGFSPFAFGGPYSAVLEGASRTVPAIWMPANPCTSCVGAPAQWSAVVAHEMGHALGLRHVNNSDGDVFTTDSAWDYMSAPLMAQRNAGALQKLPYSLHAQQRYELGWLDEQQVLRLPTDLGEFEVLVNIDFDPSSSGVQMVSVELPGSEDLVLTVRSPGRIDDASLAEPAVFIHTYDPTRFEPLWLFDAGLPVPNMANSATSYFVPGERFEREVGNQMLTVTVLAADSAGMQVSVRLGVSPQVFLDGFEP